MRDELVVQFIDRVEKAIAMDGQSKESPLNMQDSETLLGLVHILLGQVAAPSQPPPPSSC